jgi:GNAT superfamily N-acetyltransferase
MRHVEPHPIGRKRSIDERQGRGIGRALVEASLAQARHRGCARVCVATATADVANLRFYQRLGFRMTRVERDAFVPATGYPDPIELDGHELGTWPRTVARFSLQHLDETVDQTVEILFT